MIISWPKGRGRRIIRLSGGMPSVSRRERWWPLRLTWDNLHKQFGADNASIRSFKQAFKGELAHIKEVFPRLRVSLDDGGMQLLPTDPSELLVPPKRPKSEKPAASAA